MPLSKVTSNSLSSGLTLTGVSTFAAGTAAAPSLTTSGDTNTGIFFPAADTVGVSTGGSERMRIDTAGITKFRSTGSAYDSTPGDGVSDGLYLQVDSSGIAHIDSYAGGGSTNLAFGTNSGGGAVSERMRIDTSGNVGIGTSSPSTKLHVVSSSGENKIISEATAASQQASLSLIVQAATPGQTVIYMGKTGATTNGQVGYDPNNNYLYLYTNNTERMRIDNEGDLLINTTSTNNNEKVRIKNGNDSRAIAFQSASAAECGYIYINAGGTSTTYSTSSDYRLKENIASMTGALAKVQALKPVTYKWKINGFDGQGFIAHELQEVVPDCVTGLKDAVQTYTDEEGNEATRPVYQGVDTSFLVATLTAAIQEQQALITAQSETITALTARIVALESA